MLLDPVQCAQISQFEEVSSTKQRRQFMQLMLEMKSIELARRGNTNPFSSRENIRFLVHFTQNHPEISRLYILYLGEKPIAFALCLAENKNLIMYQTTYDRTFAKLSPGALLLHDIIMRAAATGYSTFDFSFGDDEYKKSICNRRLAINRAIVPQNIIAVRPEYCRVQNC